MEYQTRLPATHLGGEPLQDLETLLTRTLTDPDLEVHIDQGRVVFSASSLQAAVDEFMFKRCFSRFEVVVTGDEGRVEISADGRMGQFDLRLSGERDWVRSMRPTVEEFFREHSLLLRTYLERYTALIMGVLAILGGLALYGAGHGDHFGIVYLVDILLVGSVALITGGLFHLALNLVYPYVALIPEESSSQLTYLRRQ